MEYERLLWIARTAVEGLLIDDEESARIYFRDTMELTPEEEKILCIKPVNGQEPVGEESIK